MRRRGKQNRKGDGKPDPPATVASSSSALPETEASATSTQITPSSLGAVALRSTNTSRSEQRRPQPIELGTIEYCNITPDGRHGDMDAALSLAAATGKPIFANFVEWSG
jgi:hypothetical protein